MPGIDLPVKLQDLHAQLLELVAKSQHALPGKVRDALVIGIGDNVEQLLDAAAADPRDNAELRQMRADRIDHSGLLPDEQMPGPMQHQAGLLVGRFHRNEAHVRPLHRLANRLGIGGVILLAFNIGFDIGRRHQANRMAERLQLARPVMRRCAGFDPDKTGRQLLKERQHPRPPQLPTHDDLALCIDAVDLKHRLRNIETDCGDRLHHRLRQIVVTSAATNSLATFAPGEEPSTASEADCR